MKDEGYTLSDLDGEVRARGLDLEDVEIGNYLTCDTPEEAAREIEYDEFHSV